MAAFNLGDIFVTLKAKVEDMQKGLGKASDAIGNFADQVDSRFRKAEEGSRNFGIALAGLTAGTVAFGKKAYDEYKQSAAIQTKLTTVILNRVGASEEDVFMLKRQAQEQQKLGVVSADATMAAQAQLATFDLSGEAISNLIPSFLDMAVAEKGAEVSAGDLKDMANGLGKAMQGNVELFTKQGFVITENQKKMLENGNEMERVATIAEILGGTYEGVNAAMRDSQPLVVAKNNFGDFVQLFGEFVNEYVSEVIQGFNDWFASMDDGEAIIDRIVEFVEGIKRNFPVVIGIIVGGLVPALYSLAGSLWATYAPLVPLLAIGAAVGLILDNLAKRYGGWDEVLKKAQPTLMQVRDFLQGALTNALSRATSAIQTISDWYERNKQTIMDYIGAIRDFLAPIIAMAIRMFQQMIPPILELINRIRTSEGVMMALKAAGLVLVGVVVAIIAIFVGLIAVTFRVVGSMADAVNKFWSFARQFPPIWSFIADAVRRGVDAVVGFISGIVGRIASVGGRIKNALLGPFEDARDAIGGIVNGIKEKLDKINPFHRESPSLVDYVEMGTEAIFSSYKNLAQSLSSMELAVAPMGQQMMSQGSGTLGSTKNVVVNQQINATLADGMDVNMLSSRLAYKIKDNI